MTAALTGLPLLALLAACFVALPVLVALFIAAGRGSGGDAWLVDLRDGECENPRCPCRWGDAG